MPRNGVGMMVWFDKLVCIQNKTREFPTGVSLPHSVTTFAVHLRVRRVHEGAGVQVLRTAENEN